MANQQNINTRTFSYNGATVTLVARPKNRHRELLRQVYRKVASANPSLSNGTCQEFSTVVVYTEDVDGDLWKPPSPHATEAELAAALQAWMDEDEALTDLWLAELEKN